MACNSDTYSLESLSLRSETKEKFDALLKAAEIRKKKHKSSRAKSQSKEKLLDNDDSATENNENVVEKDVLSELNTSKTSRNDKNYVLNKFLEQDNDILTVDVAAKNREPPIPKPRKKLKKLQPDDDGADETLSQNTYTASPKVSKLKNTSSSSINTNKTYDVEVGDVLVHHQSPSRTKIVVKSVKSSYKIPKEIVEKADVETLNDISASDDTKTEQEEERAHEKLLLLNNVNEDINTKNGKGAIELKELHVEKNEINYSNEQISKTAKRERIKYKHKKAEDEKNTIKETNYKYDNIVEIIIHRTDRLKLNPIVVHPVVKVHLVDIDTGRYFEKSNKSRPVVFFYENNDYEYIFPVITHAYNLQEHRALFPCWEETILLNEDYQYLIDHSSKIILFFEVLDFVTFSKTHHISSGCSEGWHNIALAFLKLSSPQNIPNTGKKLRLQLYKIPSNQQNRKHIDADKCHLWFLWRENKFKKYPSTLYVTVKSVISPEIVVGALRSQTPRQGEKISAVVVDELNYEVSCEENAIEDATRDASDNERITIWSKSVTETCKIPNKCLTEFDSYDEGCLVMRFSHDGKFLACAVKNEEFYCVVVFSVRFWGMLVQNGTNIKNKVISLKKLIKFPCHQGLIYDVKWSFDDDFLISASADNTIAIINFKRQTLIQILPHPSFVYSCDITSQNIIVSGCYDGTLRLWKMGGNDKYHLFQEFERRHMGFITSLCLIKDGNIFSADSVGVINEWSCDEEMWGFAREILILDLKETVINQAVLFNKNKRMLVHSRDSTIRIVDLKSCCVLFWLRGALNKRMQSYCTISHCGTYVFSGSENGHVYVWNSKNGQEETIFTPFCANSNKVAIHCVQFHPFDNFLAVSHYGDSLPILFYSFDKTSEVGDCMKGKKVEKIGKIEVMSNFGVKKMLKSSVQRENGVQNDFKGVLKKMDQVIAAQTIS